MFQLELSFGGADGSAAIVKIQIETLETDPCSPKECGKKFLNDIFLFPKRLQSRLVGV